MHSSRPAHSKKSETEQDTKSDSLSKTILKWVGFVTAIVSLILGGRQVIKLVSDRFDTNKKINALLAAEEVELSGHDYSTAWRTLEQASALNGKSREVWAAQEKLAMEWLENIQPSPGEHLSDITQKLEPVLTRGIALSKLASRQADFMAHLGWCYFLQSLEGREGLDPAGTYARAVKEDGHNPYAHAMWGYGILADGGSLSDATSHFNAALSSGRERAFVRSMQLSALMLHDNNSWDEEAVRVADDIRKENGAISDQNRHALLGKYYFRMLPPATSTRRFVEAVPPAEHLATFHWLFDSEMQQTKPDVLKTYYLAVLEEAAGNRDAALKDYQFVVAAKGSDQGGTVFTAAAAGKKRLSEK
jgi:hypothetical protein